MSGKIKILIGAFAGAAVVVLGVYIYMVSANLADYRLAARYSSSRAFEETVNAVDELSTALQKSVYATDGSMCGKICGEAYANALAAETAVSTLPFSTQELEQISGFLNVAGDYAYTLISQVGDEGFTEEQLKDLTDMSAVAAGLSDTLRQLQGSLNAGDVIMDSREARLENVNSDDGLTKLSQKMLEYEATFQSMGEVQYDGKFTSGQEEQQGELSPEEMLALAAEYAGVAKEELKEEENFHGENGRICYRAGEMLICVGPSGVESMSQSRLVSDGQVSLEQAEQTAADFLAERGFENLELSESGENGSIAVLRFSRVENGAVALDNSLSVSVALDDGSIYSLNAADYSDIQTETQWEISEEDASGTLPESLTPTGSRKVIIKSAGGRELACYEFNCMAEDGRQVRIYVDAVTGRQCEILI